MLSDMYLYLRLVKLEHTLELPYEADNGAKAAPKPLIPAQIIVYTLKSKLQLLHLVSSPNHPFICARISVPLYITRSYGTCSHEESSNFARNQPNSAPANRHPPIAYKDTTPEPPKEEYHNYGRTEASFD